MSRKKTIIEARFIRDNIGDMSVYEFEVVLHRHDGSTRVYREATPGISKFFNPGTGYGEMIKVMKRITRT